MFPDFSAMGKSMDQLNEHFATIAAELKKQTALLEIIAKGTAPEQDHV